METKRCSKCGAEKPRTEFHRNRHASDGLQCECKACIQTRRRALAARRAMENINRDPYADACPKRCARCRETKARHEFYTLKTSADGLCTFCKPCARAVAHASSLASNLKDRSGYLERRRQRRVAKREQYLATERRSAAKHREQRNEARRRYRLAHIEKERAYSRAYYRRRAAYAREYSRQWYHANREHALANNLKAGRRNPAANVARVNRRRARLKGNGGTYTPAEWHALCEQYGNRCLGCGSIGPLTVDHVVPVSKGGTNDITNIQPLCFACNQAKGTRTIDYRPSFGKVRQMDLLGPLE